MREMIGKLERISRHMGVLSGIGMTDESAASKNLLLYQQEVRSLMQDGDNQLMPEEVFGSRKNKAVEELLKLYAKADASGLVAEKALEKTLEEASGVVLTSMYVDEGSFKRLLSCYAAGEELQPEALILWSVRLNRFLQEQGLLAVYYVPFAKYLWKIIVSGPREALRWKEELEWQNFYLSLFKTALDGTVKIICSAIARQRQSKEIIATEKHKTLLDDMLTFMEETPVFDIKEMAEEFQVAYNTAAKMVNILVQHELVAEITSKQRYRIYCYEKYLQEYGGLD